MYVKLCGITRPGDAELAVDLGADAIGLNFWPPSLRFVGGRAREIADAVRGRAKLVGVFVDAPAAEVLETMATFGLDYAQLHGDERPESCLLLPANRWYKALRAVDASVLDAMAEYTCGCVLFDAGRPGRPGGTGERCDWTVAAQGARERKVILAGGLGPHNVGAAIRRVRPYGVDAASGIEEAPGRKDAARMKAFVEAAREASAS